MGRSDDPRGSDGAVERGRSEQSDATACRDRRSGRKALTRRVAAGQSEYANLKPAGELSYALQCGVYRLLQHPVEWLGPEPDEAQRREFLDTASAVLTGRLIALTTQRVVLEHQPLWLSAYHQSGPGSTRVRARLMEDDIYERAAPATLPPSRAHSSELVQAVAAAVAEVADEVGFVLRG